MVITPKQYRDLIDKDSDLKMVSESQGELKGETWIRFTMKDKEGKLWERSIKEI